MSHGVISGLLAGVIASLCCLGPVILGSLGLAAMFGLTGLCLLDLRPLFFSVGLLFIAVAGFLHFRKGCKSCTVSPQHKLAFVALALIAMVIVYLVFMWVILPQFLLPAGGLTCTIPI